MLGNPFVVRIVKVAQFRTGDAVKFLAGYVIIDFRGTATFRAVRATQVRRVVVTACGLFVAQSLEISSAGLGARLESATVFTGLEAAFTAISTLESATVFTGLEAAFTTVSTLESAAVVAAAESSAVFTGLEATFTTVSATVFTGLEAAFTAISTLESATVFTGLEAT
ncbi:hypothetical protein DQ353_00005, partial [Arthrobacter sp. AQ5-05]|uniref:hypothetical protein n=1 Tax=Arthrobacter sp. AQ5-05 TaxID=2184581 RepID=UPI000DCD4B85